MKQPHCRRYSVKVSHRYYIGAKNVLNFSNGDIAKGAYASHRRAGSHVKQSLYGRIDLL